MTTDSAAGSKIELTGKLARLREFRETDLEAAFAIFGDDRVTETLSFNSRSREETRSILQAVIARTGTNPSAEYYLAVTRLNEEQVIGFVRLGLAGVQAAKLGYAIGGNHWGHGYATDAAQSMLDLAFTKIGLHRVTAAIGPGNVRSIAVVERLGFSLEGRLRDHVFTNGSWRDSLLYSILAKEWIGAGRTQSL